MKRSTLLLICLLVFVALVGGAAAWMYFSPGGALAPVTAEDAVQELLDTTDTTEWRAKYVSLCAPETSVFENAETVAGDLFDAAVQGQKFSFRRDSENTSRNSPVYILSAGENDLLRLNAAYDKTSRAWKVEPAPLKALHAEARTLTITVPEGSAVSVNGIALGEEYITDSHVPYTGISELETQFDTCPYRVTYTVPGIYETAQVDARDREALTALMREHRIDFVMDAASPFVSNFIFDAAFEAGADYASMGTWSVPKDHPEFGKGFEGAYLEPMTKYNFDRHEAWKEKGQMACICLGIDPGVVNVFAKYAAEYLFDELLEVHVKDGGNLTPPESEKDEIIFGFNVWTVLDEVMNPNAEWSREGGFLIEDAFAGEEDFRMPEPFGVNHLVKVEHEEVVTMPRYLEKYGLQKASFKIALDDNLLNALKVLDKLGLRNIHPVQVGDVKVVPRDVVAACAPQPKDIGEDMTGGMCVGVDCIGIKDGEKKEYFIYQPFDNQEALRDFGLQAVVAQTGFGAALAIELMGRGIWKEAGVFSPEYFPSRPYMDLMEEAGLAYQIQER